MIKGRTLLLLLILAIGCAGVLAAGAWAGGIPARAETLFGPPSPARSAFESWRLAWSLVEQVDALTLPADPAGEGRPFEIGDGEPAMRVIERLAEAALIRDPRAFRDLLIYSGADTRLVPGIYTLSPAMTALEIAAEIQNIAATGITLTVLAGWRLEQIAAALPTSGLSTSPEEFLRLAMAPPSGGVAAYWPAGATHEGLLFPGGYSLPRDLPAEALIDVLTENFRTQLNRDIQAGFEAQSLNIFQAVTLASIVQREAVVNAEMPRIASVFLNRLAIQMKLEADPTVQYALGYSDHWGWWKAPLSLDDLAAPHPYNTYRIPGLPPGPIANPGIEALLAVAFPEPSGYYYFRAACDGSGTHIFAQTFEEHQRNGCP